MIAPCSPGVAPRDALANWDNEGGALAPPDPQTEMAQLRRRILVLENLVIALMTDSLPAPRGAPAQTPMPNPDRAPAGPTSREASQS